MARDLSYDPEEHPDYYERSPNGRLYEFRSSVGADPIQRETHGYSGSDWEHAYDQTGQPTLRYVGPTVGWYTPPRWSDLESFDSHAESDEIPSVYIIHAPSSKRVKIGQSRQVYKRFSAIRTMAGTDVKLIAVLDKEDELHLHKRFAARRIVGEWFDESVLDDLRADGTIS